MITYLFSVKAEVLLIEVFQSSPDIFIIPSMIKSLWLPPLSTFGIPSIQFIFYRLFPISSLWAYLRIFIILFAFFSPTASFLSLFLLVFTISVQLTLISPKGAALILFFLSTLRGHEFLIYADDIIIVSSNISLNLVIETLNLTKLDLNDTHNRSFLVVTFVKCKSVIFTRRRYLYPPNVYFDNIVIPFVFDVISLGITLDFKLR